MILLKSQLTEKKEFT